MQFFFFFNDTATTEIYTLSLHDALPISPLPGHGRSVKREPLHGRDPWHGSRLDRKSTRLNSSHLVISYAVFCLKKKNYIGLHLLNFTYTRSLNVEARLCDAPNRLASMTS